jgi:large subunit ribosomal protein L18Ae
MCFGV